MNMRYGENKILFVRIGKFEKIITKKVLKKFNIIDFGHFLKNFLNIPYVIYYIK